MSRFGAELRRRRAAAGMSLAALAATLHFTKGYLSKVENGKARVTQSVAEACDRLFDARGELVALAEEAAPVRRRSGGLIGLPDGTRHFVGRKAEFESLLAMLTAQRTVRVCVVHGMAGAGKTALVLAAARAAAGRFPDGCLFFDLLGHTPGALELSPSDVMYRLLHLLELPGDTIPPDIDGRANLLQDCLRDSRMLLVFDNVRSAAQVRRLLPAAPGCRVLITSRGRLPAIDDAWHLHVGMLTDDEAMAVFRSVAGERMPADADAMGDIVARCGKLPLAIRIAAARFASGGWTAARFRDRLNDETKRLSTLDDGERSVEAAFAVSYAMLPAEERKLFGLLALHSGGPAETASVSALAGSDDVDDLIDRLHDAHLLTRHPDGYVGLHDLMRAFAGQYALPEITTAGQDAAAARLVRRLLGVVVIADELTEPHRFRPVTDCARPRAVPFDDAAGAMSWLRGQWPVLVDTVDLAGERGLHAECWQLAFVLRAFFYREKLFGPWLRSHRRALSSAEAVGDLSAAGMILNNLGMVHLEVGDVTRAVDCHHRARACFTDAEDERGATDALSSLAWARLYQGRPEEALRDLTAALAVYRRTERTRNVMIALRGLAFALSAMDRPTEALPHAEEARDLAKLSVDALMSLNCLGWTHFRAGNHDEARGCYQEAVNLAELADSDYERARACTGLGNIAATEGDHGAAKRWWTEADDHRVELSPFTLPEVPARAELSRGQ